jgi:nitroreductase
MDNFPLFLEAMQNRFACKLYKDQPLSDLEITTILEAARLSPTSFGLEAWHFHVVTDLTLRKELTEACFDQESVLSAPVSIILTALREEPFATNHPFLIQRALRFPTTLEEFVDDYVGYYDFLVEKGRLECWARSQCYIAAANMMSIAAANNIQSCAIEGFDEEKVAKVINLDLKEWQVALVIPFGYPAESNREKIREPLESLVTYH